MPNFYFSKKSFFYNLQNLKTFLECNFRYGVSSFSDFVFISSMLAKHCPLMIFEFSEIRRSCKELCPAMNCEQCTSCTAMSCFTTNPKHYLQIASSKQYTTSRYYSLLTIHPDSKNSWYTMLLK